MSWQPLYAFEGLTGVFSVFDDDGAVRACFFSGAAISFRPPLSICVKSRPFMSSSLNSYPVVLRLDNGRSLPHEGEPRPSLAYP